MKPALAVLVAALAAALVGTTDSRTAGGPAQATKALPVLGISRAARGGVVAWFDPLTLQMRRGRKAPLGYHSGTWAFSRDRGVLAVGDCDEGYVRGIRFVNTRAMRVLGDLKLPPAYECVSSLTWLRPNRLLAVLSSSWAIDAQVAVVDPITRRVLRRTPLPTVPWSAARSNDELVLLFASHGSFAPARVGVVDPEGGVRAVTVEQVLAGSVVVDEQTHRVRTISPGFTVDPEGRRAFLVPASGSVAEVDLRTLAVSYHELDPPSLFGRLLRWLEPDAEAKSMEGTVREARWLGDETLATSGVEYSIAANGETVAEPTGVRLVDTRSWRTRTLSTASRTFVLGADLVIAEGGGWGGVGAQRVANPGLLAFDLAGSQRWVLHSGEERWIETAGAVGYVDLGPRRLEVVDLATGTVVRVLRRGPAAPPWPQLLAAQASGS